MEVHVTAEMGRNREHLAELQFLVDTGSFYSAIPPRVGRDLELGPGLSMQVMLADGRIVDTEVTLAYIKLLGRQGAVPVEVIDVPIPLLGVSALETLGMK